MKSKSYKTKMLGIVSIVDPQGHTLSRESVWSDSPRIYGILKDAWGADNSGDINVPVEFAKSRRAFVKPQMCLYDATSKYLNYLFGIHMDWPDEDFFGEHPLTSPEGVSEDKTLRVVNDLIAPYGFGVSAIRLSPGVSLGSDMKAWQHILGVNPLGLTNRNTTNKLFAETTGMPLEEVQKLFRFEFSNEPLRPCISCGMMQFVMSGRTDKTESGGHATYQSYRAKINDPLLTFQIDRLENIHWHKQPDFPDVPPKEESLIYSLYDIVNRDKTKSMSALLADSFGKSQKKDSQASIPTILLDSHVGATNTTLPYIGPKVPNGRICFACDNEYPKKDIVGSNLCSSCWRAFWGEYDCAMCGTNMGLDPRLAGLSRKGKSKHIDEVLKISARCGKCDELQDISSKDEHLVPFVYDMICGKKPEDVDIIWDHYVRGDLGDDSTREPEQRATESDPSVSDS